jgi:hypothetical protein
MKNEKHIFEKRFQAGKNGPRAKMAPSLNIEENKGAR